MGDASGGREDGEVGRGAKSLKRSWGVEGEGRECFRFPLYWYPYFSGWKVGGWMGGRLVVGGIGTKAKPFTLIFS